MIDAACNYMNPYTSKFPTSAGNFERISSVDEDIKPEFSAMSSPSSFLQPSASQLEYNTFYKMNSSGSLMTSCPAASEKIIQTVHQTQYPPQPSSTGSTSPNSSMSAASTSPSIFPSPSSSSTSSSSMQNDLAGSYSWNAYTAGHLSARPPPPSMPPQFPYAQYAAAPADYYSNMAMPSAAASSWFSHQDRLYQPWSSNSYGFNFEDIAFQTQLQRRSVRCTCPNCTNEMSGLPPIVGPDERGRKQHICHIPGCERLYGKASHLKTHLRWHTGERPFLCLTCGKRFSRSDELQRHGRTHTNYRPYSCPICSKKFSRSDHLSKHKKTHLKDKKSKKTADAKDATSKKETTTTKPEPSPAVETSAAVKTEPSASLASSSTSHNEIPAGYTPYNLYQNSPLFSAHHQSHHHPLHHQHQQSSSMAGLFYNRPSEVAPIAAASAASLPHLDHQSKATQDSSGLHLMDASSSRQAAASNESQHQHHQYDSLAYHPAAAAMASQVKSDYPYHEYASAGYAVHPHHAAHASHHIPSWTNYHATA